MNYITIFKQQKTRTRRVSVTLPVHTTMAQYQIYTKYMLISSFLQYLADNLLPFVVNVIAKHDVATVSPAPYTD